MIEVSNADRVVFPDIARTKGDVVAYYERIAPRALPHVAGRLAREQLIDDLEHLVVIGDPFEHPERK